MQRRRRATRRRLHPPPLTLPHRLTPLLRRAAPRRLLRPRPTDPMAGAADWITLAEAVDILAASNVHFTRGTIGGWARSGRLQSIKLGGRRYVRRGEVRALVAAPRRVRAQDVQSVLFEEWSG
jgi:hypothetical protein